jgi:hypothetical protein
MEIQLDINSAVQPIVRESKKIRRLKNTTNTIKQKIDVSMNGFILTIEGYFTYIGNITITEAKDLLQRVKIVIPELEKIKTLLEYVSYYNDNNLQEKAQYCVDVNLKLEKLLLLYLKNNLNANVMIDTITINSRNYVLSTPLNCNLTQEEDYFVVYNELLDIIGTGQSVADAEQSFYEEFDFLYQWLNNSPDKELSKRLIGIKNTINEITKIAA